MKRIGLLFLVLLLPVAARTEIGSILFVPEEFDVDIFLFPHMLSLANPPSDALDTYYTLRGVPAS